MLNVRMILLLSLSFSLMPSSQGFSAPMYSDAQLESARNYDGLKLIKHPMWDETWINPEVDFSSFTHVLIKPIEVAFKEMDSDKVRLRRNLSKTEFPVSEANRKIITQETNNIFKRTLIKSPGFKISEKADQDVMAVKVSVIDIVSHVPPEPFGVSDIYLKSFAKATLVLELTDSLSGEVLLRTVDHKAAERFGEFVKVSRITEITEMRRLMQRWATQTENRLSAIIKLSH